jgi:predicted AAA+ superfamily ATPase
MKRCIDYYLLEWKQEVHRKPLLLRGARQVGKTYAIRTLGSTFEHFIEVNLEQDRVAKAIFERDLDIKRIIFQLSTHLNKDIIPGKTLLFIDEIQQCPSAITALRYFYEQIPELHLIAAGSLLEFAIQQIGMPVGRISSLYLYPMSFIEFLIADNKPHWVKAILHHNPETPIFDQLHTQLLESLHLYCIVGGMPEAVKQWVSTQSLRTITKVHTELLDTYRQDFSKYGKLHQIKYLELLFAQAVEQIGTKFTFTKVGEYKKRELAPALDLLEKAGLVHKIFKTAAQGIPLGAQADLNDFKIAFLDVGLCQTALGLDSAGWIHSPHSNFINQGALIESLIGQELLTNSDPIRKQDLFYWRRNSRGSDAEVDYVIQLNHTIIPIEVKAGTSKRIKSSYLFLESHPSARYGIRFSSLNYGRDAAIHTYPLYAVALVLQSTNPSMKLALEYLTSSHNT